MLVAVQRDDLGAPARGESEVIGFGGGFDLTAGGSTAMSTILRVFGWMAEADFGDVLHHQPDRQCAREANIVRI